MNASITIRQEFGEAVSIEEMKDALSKQMEASNFEPARGTFDLAIEPFWGGVPGTPTRVVVATMNGFRGRTA